MRVRLAIVLGVVAVCSLGTANAAVLWKGDFETGDLKQWDTTTLIRTGDRENLVLEGDNVAEGKTAAQITLRPDIIFEPYNQSRVEVSHNGLHTKNGEDSYFAWSFLVPEDAKIRSNIGYWESRDSYRNTMTFFIEPAAGGGTALKFGTGNLGQTLRWTTQLELGKWHRLAIHNHWSQSDADGKVDVWYDGAQVVTGATATKYNADQLFFQLGLHRSDPAPPVQVIYVDAALETDTQADILAPLLGTPNGGSGGSAANGGSGAGGSAGMGGSGGSAGAAEGGALGGGGANGGTPAEVGGSSGNTPTSSGTGGATPLGGASASAPTSTDSSGCALVSGPAAHRWPPLLVLSALALLRRRRR